MSNLGNKVSRLSAGTQARQEHRTEVPKMGLSSYEVAQRVEAKVIKQPKPKKAVKKRKKSK